MEGQAGLPPGRLPPEPPYADRMASEPAPPAHEDADEPAVAPLPSHVPKKTRHVSSLVLVHTGHGKGKTSAAAGIMVRGLARGWRVAVGLFNRSWSVRDVSVNLAAIGFPGGANLRDVWKQKDLGRQSGVFTDTLVKHGVTLLIVSE